MDNPERVYREMLARLPDDNAAAIHELDEAFRAVGALFDGGSLSRTRFASDMECRSLLLAAMKLQREGGGIEGKDLRPLRLDLRLLDRIIARGPEESAPEGNACRADREDDAAEVRRDRGMLLASVLAGTFHDTLPDRSVDLLGSLVLCRGIDETAVGSDPNVCASCGEPFRPDRDLAVAAWRVGDAVHQVSNAFRIHAGNCSENSAEFTSGRLDRRARDPHVDRSAT